MTTHTTPIDLRPFHGREVEAATAYRTIKSKIMVDEDGDIYVRDSMGAVWIQAKNQEVFDGDYLKSITILDEPNPINPEWDWKDGEIVRLDNREYKVCKIHDDIVVFIVDGRSTGSYTNQEAYIEGWRKLPPQPQRKLVEITEEMFRSTLWYNKKVMYGELEQGIYAVHYNSGYFTLVQSGTIHYSQCKLIEE